jgi:hypothetical protein
MLSRWSRVVPPPAALHSDRAAYAVLAVCFLIVVARLHAFEPPRALPAHLLAALASGNDAVVAAAASSPAVAASSASSASPSSPSPSPAPTANAASDAPAPAPHSAAHLGRLVKERAKDNTVLLVGGNIGFLQLLKNMVCRLRELQIENFVVAAFDEDVLAYCVRQQLPAFLAANERDEPANVTHASASIDQPEFAPVTKLKSIQVLRVLRLGVDVVLSDLDAFFLENPLPFLRALPPSVDIAALSDGRFSDPMGHSVNSGFYFVRSNARTLRAFELIVRKGADDPLRSEQPKVNYVLCGANYEYRVDKVDTSAGAGAGGERVYVSSCDNSVLQLHTRFLPQDLFLNGDLWDWRTRRPRRASPLKRSPIFVHSNWNYGLDVKVQSLKTSLMWRLDHRGRCLEPDLRAPFDSPLGVDDGPDEAAATAAAAAAAPVLLTPANAVAAQTQQRR